MVQNGKTLSMHNDAIWKGTYTHNGMLLKIHENAYTIGYSALLKADGTEGATAKFGDGVFLDASQNNNRAYVGAPTVAGAIPVFGGIIVREPAIASGYPAINDEIAPFQKGLLVREGFVIYKNGKLCTAAGAFTEKGELFGKVYPNFCIFVNKTNGEVYFSPKSTIAYQSGDIMIGRVVETNPDDKSVTVKVSPVLQADTTDIAGATPTLTLGTATNTTMPLVVTQGVVNDVVISYKKHADTDYINVATVTPAWDVDNSNYAAAYTINDLEKNTSYDVKVETFSACGLKSATATKSTTNV